MRPPVLPSGNVCAGSDYGDRPSGNRLSAASETPSVAGFNEAAGFTQRKQRLEEGEASTYVVRRFNEAAGFTQRKRLVRGRCSSVW